MPIDLSDIPTPLLRAELARRSMAEGRGQGERPSKGARWKWVCAKCTNTVYGGGDLHTVFAESGRVWCRICIPDCRINFYGANGTERSVPMQQLPADGETPSLS
jgi:hypothetical protein